MADAILREAGVRTGLFTSPHLVSFHERLTLNGQPIPGHDLAQGLTLLRELCTDLNLEATFFELVVALAWWWFEREGAEVVVWETGMGGRLDATNAVLPEVCVLTPVSFDHQRWLGDTLPAIAKEKAGILKPGRPAFFLPQEPEAEAVFDKAACRMGAPLQRIGAPWTDGPLGLIGSHQRWNAAAAIAACRVLLPGMPEEIYAGVVRRALAEVRWPGRFQELVPGWIIDGAHNVAAMQRLVRTWKETRGAERPLVLFGTLTDKDPAQLLAILEPLAADFLFVPVRSMRAVEPAELKRLAGRGQTFPTVEAALQKFLTSQKPPALLVTGSLFLAGEILAWWQHLPAPKKGAQ
jgi:dihydrofolate synthase/folylpolyglutamate synthase